MAIAGEPVVQIARTWQCPPSEPQHLVRCGLRIVLAVPPRGIALALRLFAAVAVGLVLLIERPVHVEHAVELAEHQAEHARGNAQRGTKDDSNIPHRHLVHARILHNEDQVRSESAEQTVVGHGKGRDEVRELPDPFLGIDEV